MRKGGRGYICIIVLRNENKPRLLYIIIPTRMSICPWPLEVPHARTCLSTGTGLSTSGKHSTPIRTCMLKFGNRKFDSHAALGRNTGLKICQISTFVHAHMQTHARVFRWYIALAPLANYIVILLFWGVNGECYSMFTSGHNQ